MRLRQYLAGVNYKPSKPINLPGINWRAAEINPSLKPNECHIWALNLDQEENCVERLIGYLSPSEADQASRFYNELDQRRYALGRSLLRILISIYTDIEPKEIELRSKEKGKPYLPKTDLQFSKSASGPIGLVALTWNAEVGVDIEKIQHLDRVSQLVKSGFSTSEHLAFQKTPISQREKVFFCGWTRKEAIVKALGIGFALAPDQVIVSLDASLEYEFKIPSLPSENTSNWTLKSWPPIAGYQAALAIRSSNVALSFFNLSS